MAVGQLLVIRFGSSVITHKHAQLVAQPSLKCEGAPGDWLDQHPGETGNKQSYKETMWGRAVTLNTNNNTGSNSHIDVICMNSSSSSQLTVKDTGRPGREFNKVKVYSLAFDEGCCWFKLF